MAFILGVPALVQLTECVCLVMWLVSIQLTSTPNQHVTTTHSFLIPWCFFKIYSIVWSLLMVIIGFRIIKHLLFRWYVWFISLELSPCFLERTKLLSSYGAIFLALVYFMAMPCKFVFSRSTSWPDGNKPGSRWMLSKKQSIDTGL